MAEWKDKTVRREHAIKQLRVQVHEVEGRGQMDIWLMQETYRDNEVTRWEQTEKGKFVQSCVKGTCQMRKLITEFSPYQPESAARSWMCPKCSDITVRAKRAVESKEDYKEQFPKRVMKFSRALRKRHPELNSRKSRKSNDVIVNGSYWGEDAALRKKINIFGYEWNLHVLHFKQQDENDGVERVRFSVVDISPMFDEHFRDHGHRGGIKKVNR